MYHVIVDINDVDYDIIQLIEHKVNATSFRFAWRRTEGPNDANNFNLRYTVQTRLAALKIKTAYEKVFKDLNVSDKCECIVPFRDRPLCIT